MNWNKSCNKTIQISLTFKTDFEQTLDTHENKNFINQICLKIPPLDTTLPNLFYTNVKKIECNFKTHFETH
jgi:hypothetical protein